MNKQFNKLDSDSLDFKIPEAYENKLKEFVSKFNSDDLVKSTNLI